MIRLFLNSSIIIISVSVSSSTGIQQSSNHSSMFPSETPNMTNTANITNNSSIIIGAMATSLLILTIIVCTTIVIVILLWRRKMANDLPKDIGNKNQSIANPIYRGEFQ